MTIIKTETKINIETEKNFEQLPRKRINLKKVNYFLYCLIIVSGIFYIMGANQLVTKGFILRDLKNQINEINYENKKLEAELVFLDSYKNINEKISKLKMVPVSEIEYLSSGSGIVAKK